MHRRSAGHRGRDLGRPRRLPADRPGHADHFGESLELPAAPRRRWHALMTAESTTGKSKPYVRNKTVRVHNDGSMRSVVDAGEFGTFVTDEPVQHGGGGTGPSPLQTVLGALCGCEAVTFHRTAAEMGFSYGSIDFEASFSLDIRGRQGDRSVTPYFQKVRVRATVTTEEPEHRLREVVEETEARCPVFNLVSAASVDLDVTWVRAAP
ncbi:MAG: hypothetical protein GEV03_27355 [Streptosporangiales bacterium]|nr:hypothetical protein [Streptosporangiales bacterium]